MTDTSITVEPCVDTKYIDDVFAHPDVKSKIGCDRHPEMPSALLVMSVPGAVFLKISANGVPAGGALLWEVNGRAEVHTALFPNLRGRDAVKAGRQALDWVRANKPWTVLHSSTFTNRPEVIWFALHCGFTRGATEPFFDTVNGERVITQHLSIKL
jgi:hypothetical protein